MAEAAAESIATAEDASVNSQEQRVTLGARCLCHSLPHRDTARELHLDVKVAMAKRPLVLAWGSLQDLSCRYGRC